MPETQRGAYRLDGYAVVYVPEKLSNARRVIAEHFPVDTPVVHINDDFRGLLLRVSPKRTVRADDQFTVVCGTGFDQFSDRVRMWGIHPTKNPYFMRPTITTGLLHLVGCFYGIRNDPAPDLQVTVESKEDYERMLLYAERGWAGARLNYIGPLVNFYTKPGGMTDVRTVEAVEAEVEYLVRRWPQHVRRNPHRAGPWPEIRLKS